MEELGSQYNDFHDIWYLIIFRESVEEIQVCFKSDKSKGYFTWIRTHIYDNISLNSSQNEKCFRRSCRENQNTFYFQKNVFRKLCRLWDNAEKYGRARQVTDDNIIRRMRFARWITKATDTHLEYVILIAFARQKWLRERALTVRLFLHCLSCSSSILLPFLSFTTSYLSSLLISLFYMSFIVLSSFFHFAVLKPWLVILLSFHVPSTNSHCRYRGSPRQPADDILVFARVSDNRPKCVSLSFYSELILQLTAVSYRGVWCHWVTGI
jgi:hypothetical protein